MGIEEKLKEAERNERKENWNEIKDGAIMSVLAPIAIFAIVTAVMLAVLKKGGGKEQLVAITVGVIAMTMLFSRIKNETSKRASEAGLHAMNKKGDLQEVSNIVKTANLLLNDYEIPASPVGVIIGYLYEPRSVKNTEEVMMPRKHSNMEEVIQTAQNFQP